MAKKIRGNHLLDLGYKTGRSIGMAIDVSKKLLKRHTVEEVLDILTKVLEDPKAYADDEVLGKIAGTMIEDEAPKVNELLDEPIPYEIFGRDGIEDQAVEQMNVAMTLPITKAGALMPDAHFGYGLPIGGVLAADNAVIPFGVGYDIGCRMCMTLYDMGDDNYVERNKERLKKALSDNTRFGMTGVHDNPIDHELFERSEFKDIKVVKDLKDKAYRQIGTSGGGNHFVEFGTVEILIENKLGVSPGKYVAVLSHSGSRGFGHNIADYYSKLAIKKTPLPKHAQHLAWLDLDTEEGMEYWLAMNLALDYASANHHDIHRRIQKYLGAEPITTIENHHNFAAKEIHNGVEYVVHRKGATPAGDEEYGIIPGTMADYGYIVKGLGHPGSLMSASHGAGRVMSRKQAKQSFTPSYMKKYLKDKGIVLVGGGLDEIPFAYKKIDEVMDSQKELVEKVGRFSPVVVRMADDQPKKWEKEKKKNKKT